jgi:hypothetical protein
LELGTMRRMGSFARALLSASSCVVAVAACGATARDRDVPLAGSSAPAAALAAIAPLAPMVGGTWWTSFPDGRRQAERWHLGPGGSSLRVDSYGNASGERTCGVVRVFYWHPAEQRLRLRAFLRGGRIVEGPVQRDDDGVLAETVLAAPGAADRALVWQWTQEAADEARLWLAEGRAPLWRPMTDWRAHRVASEDVHDPSIVDGSPSLPPVLRAFAPMVGPRWQVLRGGEVARTTRFRAVPYAEIVHVRTTIGAGEGGEPEAELYVYVAPRGAPVQALLLLADGTVGEGAVTTMPGGAVRLDLECDGPRGAGSFQVELEVRDGSLQQRVVPGAGVTSQIVDRSWDFLSPAMRAARD